MNLRLSSVCESTELERVLDKDDASRQDLGKHNGLEPFDRFGWGQEGVRMKPLLS